MSGPETGSGPAPRPVTQPASRPTSRPASRPAAATASASVDAFQRAFAAALRRSSGDGEGEPDAPAFVRQPGFAVYRNTVLAACIDALAANYPTVRQLVGAAWFDAAAGAYVRERWPSEGSLAGYGDALPAFLARFAAAADLPYLPGVARLDRLWTEAHLAADAPVLDPAALAELEPQQLVTAVLVPHPAARWIRFADLPAFTIWRGHREGIDPGFDMAWHGEAALLTRPVGSVEWQAIDAATVAFLDACSRGDTFAAASAEGGDELLAMLPRLFAAGAFTRIET
jgi:hypothetical protein